MFLCCMQQPLEIQAIVIDQHRTMNNSGSNRQHTLFHLPDMPGSYSVSHSRHELALKQPVACSSTNQRTGWYKWSLSYLSATVRIWRRCDGRNRAPLQQPFESTSFTILCKYDEDVVCLRRLHFVLQTLLMVSAWREVLQVAALMLVFRLSQQQRSVS